MIGRGKAVDRGERCTIYKRNVEIEYPLKMKTSRELLKMINKQYPTFPFTMRNFEENRSRLGITECVRTSIVQPYPILSEKQGEYVAQFKFTVIINPKATIQITGLPLDMSSVHPSQQIQDNELNNLLSTKFNGILPQFYEPIQLPKFDPSLMNNKNEQKSNNNNNNNKNNKQNKRKNNNKNNKGNNNKNKGNQNRYRNQRNNNKNKKNQNKKKGGNQQNNKKKGNQQQRRNNNNNTNNNSNNNNENQNNNNNTNTNANSNTNNDGMDLD